MATADIELLERVDLLRLDVGRRLDPARQAEFGQYFTPAAIAAFMADLSKVNRPSVRLLDPGAGVGILSAAWIAAACQRTYRPESISVTAYERDPHLIPDLLQTLQLCADACESEGIDFASEVIEADFISSAVESLTDRPLLESTRNGFDCVILNPPYQKLASQSDARRQLRSIGVETSNLYAAFLWLSFRLLDSAGELIAITPRSFCNGPYFRPFREALLAEMAIRRIHVFDCRKSAFRESGVLQENIIIRAVKSKRPSQATISSSASPDDPDIQLREVAANELVDAESVIHIVTDEIGTRFAELVRGLPATLESLRVQVSTGRVVDFRSRDALSNEANGRTVPLIYPVHFDNGYIAWPKPGKRPNYVRNTADTNSLLVPPGSYVLVKRFSAKEEKRRITAAVCDPSRMPESDYAFENHLNYFHRYGNGLPATLTKGLAGYLNSTLVDSYFRQFSGHTQVNATDLRGLRYPDAETLERIGNRINEAFPSQGELDAIVTEELSMTDDPVAVKQRIDDAREILKSLGLPSAQLNERSVLTLLALLGLEPAAKWNRASAPLMGITPIMDWFAEHYGKRYAPNTRETVRRQMIHQFIEAGIVVQNPDDPKRAVNSGKNVYQIEAGTLGLIRTYGTKTWGKNLKTWLASVETLKTRYAREREMDCIPLALSTGETIDLSPGGQNVLVKEIIDEFCPRFTPGGKPIYIGDTDTKWAYFDTNALAVLGVSIDSHGKMPDVVIYHVDRNWLLLIEAVTSHGPVDGKRRDELKRLFADSTAGLVFVTAFLDRSAMVRYLGDISWETEVWVADAPSHMIHFNGERFLGPYESDCLTP